MRRLALLFSVVAVGGCAHLHRGAPSVREQWNTAIATARMDGDSGKYESADKVLADFIAAHRGTREATEAGFWRALYKVDPNNKNGSLVAGISGFDAYLGADSAIWYRSEAVVLRRTAAVAQALKTGASVPAATMTPGTVTVVDKDAVRSRDEEIAALREQLAKVNAELERIKKRLANPKG